jgi:hypothetical protein
MRTPYGSWDVRRLAPRLAVDTLCGETVDGTHRLGFAIELSADGVRLERPYRPGPRPTEIEVELQLPDEDEVVLATAAVRYDEIRPAIPGSALAAVSGLMRVTGLVLARIAWRDRRLLRDYVMDRRVTSHVRQPVVRSHDASRSDEPGIAFAACYARG